MISFALTYAIYGAIASTVGSLAEKFDFDSDSVSIFGAVFIISGVVGSVIHSLVLD
jgi:phage shock protein PspC (stress-responsive transcriptional regulator)